MIPLLHNNDVFIAKLDTAGNVIWGRSIGGTSDDMGLNVAADQNGNVCLSCNFESPQVIIGNDTLFNSSNEIGLLLNYDQNGNLLWYKKIGSGSRVSTFGIDYCNNEDILITGMFLGGTIQLDSLTLAPLGGLDMFVARLDSVGTAIWANRYENSGEEWGFRVSADINDNIIVLVRFDDAIRLDSSHQFISNGWDDFLVMKLDGSGNLIWANSVGGTGTENSMALTTDFAGNILVGFNSNSHDLSIGNYQISNHGNYDFVVVKYSPSGDLQWLFSAGGKKADMIWGISTDNSGDCYISGEFTSSSLNIGQIELTISDSSEYQPDLFIAKLSGTLGIPILKKNSLMVYPSPSTGDFVVLIPEVPALLSVFDINGKTIFEIESVNQNNYLSIKDQGQYYIIAISKNNRYFGQVSVIK